MSDYQWEQRMLWHRAWEAYGNSLGNESVSDLEAGVLDMVADR